MHNTLKIEKKIREDPPPKKKKKEDSVGFTETRKKKFGLRINS